MWRRVLVSLAAAASGCLATNGLHTARTVPPGAYEIHAAPQAFVQSLQDGESWGLGGMAGVRVGVVEGVDLGAQISPLQIRSEARVRLARTEHLALAVAPYAYLASLAVESDLGEDLVPAVGAGALGLVTWSPSRELAFNLVGGVEAAVLTDDGTVGLLSRQGVGLRWWVSPVFALHPEVVSVTDAERGFDLIDLAGGLGLVVAPGRS